MEGDGKSHLSTNFGWFNLTVSVSLLTQSWTGLVYDNSNMYNRDLSQKKSQRERRDSSNVKDVKREGQEDTQICSSCEMTVKISVSSIFYLCLSQMSRVIYSANRLKILARWRSLLMHFSALLFSFSYHDPFSPTIIILFLLLYFGVNELLSPFFFANLWSRWFQSAIIVCCGYTAGEWSLVASSYFCQQELQQSQRWIQ